LFQREALVNIDFHVVFVS